MDDLSAVEHPEFGSLLGAYTAEFADGCAGHEWRDRFSNRKLAFRVALTDAAAGLNAGTRPDRKVTVLPVLAGSPIADLRRASELAHGHDEGLVHQATLGEIIQQG